MEQQQNVNKGVYPGLLSTYHTPHVCEKCREHIGWDWNFCPECGTPTGLTVEDAHSFAQMTEGFQKCHSTPYAPGDTVYDEAGEPWQVKLAELREIRDGLHWLYRCGHPGTEDYCALFDWEIVSEKDAPLAREREKARLEKLFRSFPEHISCD